MGFRRGIARFWNPTVWQWCRKDTDPKLLRGRYRRPGAWLRDSVMDQRDDDAPSAAAPMWDGTLGADSESRLVTTVT
jgi:hypothetical protein